MQTVKKRPEISAAEFGRMKENFVRARLDQYAVRANVTKGDAQELSDSPQGYHIIDKIVDEEYHSSNCPDPTDWRIV